ncbi:MAG: peptide chain release factor N(5)-glutamine methyltransferase [Rhodobacteraceae bacterium]|nr:peptide chain release factor N(5)-glutamine methyltransferase [Paracoccaceae bacterium]
MDVEALYLKVRDEFRHASLETPDLDAKLLVSSALNLSVSDLILDGSKTVSEEQCERVQVMIARRVGGEPVGRILGQREFWGLPFRLNDATLEPRPDTETLVEAVLNRVSSQAAFLFADIGTGTGAIAISLLHECRLATAIALDLSHKALECAAANAALNSVSDRFLPVCGSYLDPLVAGLDVVVSNPPYIRSDVVLNLSREVKEHDPALALDGGEDGLDAYRAIAAQAARCLKPNGLLAVEIGFDQVESVTDLFNDNGFREIDVLTDLGGNYRVIIGTSQDSLAF